MAKENEEILSGEIYADDITELVNTLNRNKNKFGKVVFDRRGDHWSFEISNEDPNNQKKLFKEIDKFIKKIGKKTGKTHKVKREKNGVVTDEVSE
jgi:hypothetical protein